jgi:hypothetical protein
MWEFFLYLVKEMLALLQMMKRNIVLILCIIGFASPFIFIQLTDWFYYSSLIGWIIGFICIVSAYVIVSKQPDEDHAGERTT